MNAWIGRHSVPQSTAALCDGGAPGPFGGGGVRRAGPGLTGGATAAAAGGGAPQREAGTPPATGGGNPRAGSVLLLYLRNVNLKKVQDSEEFK